MMLYLLLRAAIICWWVLLTSAAPALNSKRENNQVADQDFLGLNRYDLPNFSSDSTYVDIDQTVNQVEQILKLNPQLPRLSKEDILLLLKNITIEDKIKAQNDAESIVGSNIPNNGKPKDKNGEKTMLVLPYKAEDTSSGDVTELFTKAPRVTYETPKLNSKPIVVLDDDTEEDNEEVKNEQVHKNHKYSKDESKDSNSEKPSNDFWKNQAQKVMEDLEKQNQPNKIVLDIPFKKMPEGETPTDFDKNNEISNDVDSADLQSLNRLLTEGNGEFSSLGTNGAFKPLALYDFKKIPEPVTSFELALPKDGENENLEAHSSSSFVGNANNGESLFDDTNGEKSIAPKVDTSAYSAFKPLPTKNGDSKAPDLDEILQQYGLTDETLIKTYLPLPSQKEKSDTSDYITNTDFVEDDMFPASMTSVLTDMGLTKKKGRKMNISEKTIDSYNYDAPQKIDTKYGLDPMNDDEMNGVYESLNMIKREMDEETTNAEVKEVKNESSNKTAETETISKSDGESKNSESKVDSDTKEDSGPSLAALEDSFGASPADDDPAEAVLPPPRRNGFYYMVDWNTFLEVGEEGNSRKINIRFEPKLGDPHMFVFGNKNTT